MRIDVLLAGTLLTACSAHRTSGLSEEWARSRAEVQLHPTAPAWSGDAVAWARPAGEAAGALAEIVVSRGAERSVTPFALPEPYLGGGAALAWHGFEHVTDSEPTLCIVDGEVACGPSPFSGPLSTFADWGVRVTQLGDRLAVWREGDTLEVALREGEAWRITSVDEVWPVRVAWPADDGLLLLTPSPPRWGAWADGALHFREIPAPAVPGVPVAARVTGNVAAWLARDTSKGRTHVVRVDLASGASAVSTLDGTAFDVVEAPDLERFAVGSSDRVAFYDADDLVWALPYSGRGAIGWSGDAWRIGLGESVSWVATDTIRIESGTPGRWAWHGDASQAVWTPCEGEPALTWTQGGRVWFASRLVGGTVVTEGTCRAGSGDRDSAWPTLTACAGRWVPLDRRRGVCVVRIPPPHHAEGIGETWFQFGRL